MAKYTARLKAVMINLPTIQYLILAIFLILPFCVAADCDQLKQAAYDAQLNYQTEQAQKYKPESRLGREMMLDVSRVIKKPVEKTTESYANRRARQFARDWHEACEWEVYSYE